jgi:hypothetical protein
MLDFTNGWTWLACGLTATVLVVLVLILITAIAAHAERRRPPQRHA